MQSQDTNKYTSDLYWNALLMLDQGYEQTEPGTGISVEKMKWSKRFLFLFMFAHAI